jgi:hypothetical protein
VLYLKSTVGVALTGVSYCCVMVVCKKQFQHHSSAAMTFLPLSNVKCMDIRFSIALDSI